MRCVISGNEERAKAFAVVKRAVVLILILAGAIPTETSAQQPAIAASSLVFDQVTVVDVEQGVLVPNQRVVIAGNHIQAVGSRDTVKMPENARIVDAKGKYLIPGLWDMHVHTMKYAPGYFYPLFIANGITGIRDAFSLMPLDTLLQWRREILAGTRVGPPRQILSGAAIDEMESCVRKDLSGHTCVTTGDSADARRVVDQLRAAGADMIKMYGLSKESYFAIAAEARRLGIPFGGHLVGPSALEASDSGALIIDHMSTSGGLDSLCIRQNASVERCRPLVERFKRNNTWFVPTIVPMRQSLGFPVRLRSDSIYKHLVEYGSAEMWEPWAAGPVVSDSESPGVMSIMKRVGMPILAGSDMTGWDARSMPPDLTRLSVELELFVTEGLTPLEALQTATLNPAKAIHGTDSLGTVAPGKLADLVLLNANPLTDITNTMAIHAVVANGRYFDRAALNRLLAEVRAKKPSKKP